MTPDNARRILTDLCSIPTAPFAESRVIDYVERFAAARKGLRLSRDKHGNRLIELRPQAPGRRWVFAAHMDHPGFVASAMTDARTLEAHFYGSVLSQFVRGAKVRFFDGDDEIAGKVTDVTPHADRPTPQSVTVRVQRPVASGAPGMFDQGEGRSKGKLFYSRVCDDLAGAAAALAMLDTLHSAGRRPATPVAVLLTRAEEEGFIGAIGAARKPDLLKKTDRIIAIECSAEQPYAPQGKGPIIRVGDKTSIFNSSLTWFLTQTAEALAAADKGFRFQRALMPGGTCEATVYDMYGFTAASICVALGNYHNMNRARNTIGPEYINLSDWDGMVRLFVELASKGHEFEPGMKPLRKRLEGRFDQYKSLL